MAQADVLTLIDDLASYRSDDESLAEANTVARYYDDIVFETGMIRSEGPCDASFVAVTASDGDYTMPSAAIKTLVLLADDRQLRPTLRRALEAGDPEWRARTGRPVAFTTQDEDTRTFRLVPIPPVANETIGVLTPFTHTAANFPDGALTFIYTDNVTDVQAWDELWVALDVLGREFSRESDHQQPEFAKATIQLAQVLRTLVGYEA